MGKIECACGCGLKLDSKRRDPIYKDRLNGHRPFGDGISKPYAPCSPGFGTVGAHSRFISQSAETQAEKLKLI